MNGRIYSKQVMDNCINEYNSKMKKQRIMENRILLIKKLLNKWKVKID